ncbi:helix-turn-helix domain-containing protein [Sodalis sp. RH19]|uniref:helix-turn-helix domain-containing protein n=1 Tax=Sodalis sp. RH19 TaxID=3394334 RepID=UPI0039B3FD8E
MPPEHAPVIAIPHHEAFSVIVQLRDFASHRLWHDGRLVHAGGHAQQAVAITRLTEDWRCQHLSAFDNVRFLITRQALDEFTYDSGQKRIGHFDCAPGALDPVIYHLAQALIPLLGQPGGMHDFMFDHISLALFAHIAEVYGKASQDWTRQKGRLAPWQEQRAKDFMLENLSKGVSLELIARECGLSRAHFARNFKNTTGTSACVWLQNMRIRKALELLGARQQTLTEIALECGFTDQSHFSRVFKTFTGTSPGYWQRTQGGSLAVPVAPWPPAQP